MCGIDRDAGTVILPVASTSTDFTSKVSVIAWLFQFPLKLLESDRLAIVYLERGST